MAILSHNQCKRVPSKTIRKRWEEATGKPWPKDSFGNNQDVEHILPLADGGNNDLGNIQPMPHDEHMNHHKMRGDFIRWGKKRIGIK